MTRPQLITKLILAAIGVRLFVWFISIAGSAVFWFDIKSPSGISSISFIIKAVESGLLLAASLVLLFRSDGLARIIAGPDAGQYEKVDVRWIISAFQMTACLCGLLMIYSCITSLFYYVPSIIKGPILSYMTLEGQSSLLSPRLLAGGCVQIVDCIIAVYLIFGAPHYVRWQMRKLSAEELNHNGEVREYE
jgi:hypothetical protein